MSNVQVNKRPDVKVPPEYFSTLKPGCASFEQQLKIQPLITSFVGQSVPYKITTALPNVNFRLSEVYVEIDIIVTFSSSDVKDTYATVQPGVVPWATSLVNECRLLCGSTQVSDIRQLNTIFNWQQNISSNTITRLA